MAFRFHIGKNFANFDELMKEVHTYEEGSFISLRKNDSHLLKTSKSRNMHLDYKDELVYLDIQFICKHGGNYRTNRKTGERPQQSTNKINCPFKVKFAATSDGQSLQCIKVVNEHNHEITQENFKFDPKQRKLDVDTQEEISSMLKIRTNNLSPILPFKMDCAVRRKKAKGLVIVCRFSKLYRSLDMQAEKVFLKRLQKYYRVFVEQHNILQLILQKSKTVLESVQNLSEQYQSCTRIDFETCCLVKFPDLKDNLTFKILTSLESQVKSLKVELLNIEQLYEKIQKQHTACTHYYNSHTKQLDFEVLTECEPTRPSIAELYEWSFDICHHFYFEFCKRKHILDNIDYEKETIMQQVVNDWSNLESMDKSLEGILPKLKFFLAEDL